MTFVLDRARTTRAFKVSGANKTCGGSTRLGSRVCVSGSLVYEIWDRWSSRISLCCWTRGSVRLVPHRAPDTCVLDPVRTRHGTADLRLQDQQMTATPGALLIESRSSKLRQDRRVLVCPWQTKRSPEAFSSRITHQKPNGTALATLRCQRDGRAYKV